MKAHHQTVHDTIGFLAAFVLHLEESDADRRAFIDDPFWAGKPHPPKEKHLARLAALYVVGARESRGALYQQALEYAKVVNHFLAEGTAPADIPAQLRRTPIYRLLDQLSGEDSDAEPIGGAPIERPGRKCDDEGEAASDEGDDLDPDDPEDEGDPDPADRIDPKRPRRRGRTRIFDPEVHIAVTGGQFQRPILCMARQEDVWIRIRRVDDDGEVLRFDVVGLEDEEDA